MIATSTVVMFELMYLNTYAIDHVFFSQTRMRMPLLMGAVMALIMMLCMCGMYKNQAATSLIWQELTSSKAPRRRTLPACRH